MDSRINSISTVVICDFIRPLRKVARNEYHDVKLARILTLTLGIIATAIAFYVSQIKQILEASSTFIGMFGGPILALFLLGMVTRRTNFAGWFLGTVVAVPATLWLNFCTEVHWINYFPFSFCVCVFLGYPASWLAGVVGNLPVADKKLTV